MICYIILAPKKGSLAQLGEHLPYKQRVIGSSPITPTSKNTAICRVFFVLHASKIAMTMSWAGGRYIALWLTLASKFAFAAI